MLLKTVMECFPVRRLPLVLAAVFAAFVALGDCMAQSIVVTSPNGSERLVVGTTHTITWTASSSITQVKIEYSSNGGSTWSVFRASTPNDENETWVVPNIPSAFCIVRVSDALNVSVSDTSDGMFRVEPTGSWPFITTKTSGEVILSYRVGGSAAANSEIGFGYATATTPASYRHILYQDVPNNPPATPDHSLGFLPAGSGLDFYVITLGVSAYSGYRPNESFSDLDNNNGLGDTAVTVLPNEVEGYLLHLDRCTGGSDDDDDFLIEVRVVPMTESPPVAIVQTPSGIQSGLVTIIYTLKDTQGDPCTIVVRLSEDGGLTWRPATQGPGGDGVSNLTSSRTGQNHIFVWDSLTDIGQTNQNDIRVRITPSDTKVGTPGETSNFTVNNVPPPVLSSSPESFAFEGMEKMPDPESQTLEVWNSGGGDLDWRVEDNATWLVLSPTAGRNTGEKDSVTVSASIAGLFAGDYQATITVSCIQLPSTKIYVTVTLKIFELTPILSVSPTILKFSSWENGPNPPAQKLEIQNTGGHDMAWQVEGDLPWLSLAPQSGSSEGEIDAVDVSVDVTGLTIGSYAARIRVTATSSPTQSIPVLLEMTEPPPLLSVSPATIVFAETEGGANPLPQEAVIQNVGTGEFSWEISEDAPWLTASPTTGTNTGEPDIVVLHADIGGLLPGTYVGRMTATAAEVVNSPQEVEITLLVAPKPPTLSASPAILSFSAFEGGENPPPQELVVRNVGRGDMDWQASSDMPWLRVSPAEGTSAGEDDTIAVSIDIAGLTSGSYAAHVSIASARAVNSPVVIPVLLDLAPPPPRLAVSPTELTFACIENEEPPPPQGIEIQNVGSGEISWDVSGDVPWLRLNPSSGTNAGEKDNVEVGVDTAGLSTGTYRAMITVSATTSNSPQVVSVTLTVAEQPPSVLEVTPLNLEFFAVEEEGNPPAQEIRIRNAGGREMEWHAGSDAAWLSPSPESGSGKGEIDVVQILVDAMSLLPGSHSAAITVTAPGANGSPQNVQVKLTIQEKPPVLSVSPITMSFAMDEGAPDPPPQNFSVRNTGGRKMQWSASVEEEWVRVLPESGANSGTPEFVSVSIIGDGMEPGNYVANVVVEAPDAQNSPQTIEIKLLVRELKPELYVSPELLEFTTNRGGKSPPSQTLTISAKSPSGITWAASENASWLSLSPSTGTNHGEEDAVAVSVEKSGLDIGTYESDIIVRDTKKPSVTASVHVILRILPIRVPEDYSSIQKAIEAAESRDVVAVRAGTYREKIRMKNDIEVVGQGAENTTIDCNGQGTTVAFEQVDRAKIEGFTITGGVGEPFGKGAKVGGGIYFFRSSPRIAKCRVVNNSAVWGGGVCIDAGSSPVFVDCEVSDNSAVIGGGFFCYEGSSGTVSTTKICGNVAEWYGGGLFLTDSCSLRIRGCQLSGNQAAYDGGGVHAAGDSYISLVSCTIANNAAPEGAALFAEELSSVEAANAIIWGNSSPVFLAGDNLLRYSDVEDSSFAGKSGNISSDPLFVSATEDDFHLLPSSPCIDGGSSTEPGLPATDLDGEPRIMPGRLSPMTDIGADEANPETPIVLFVEVTAERNGWVYVDYKLYHMLSTPCSIVVQYSTDAGKTWRKATRSSEGEGKFSLSSSPLGEDHSFVWDSVADEGGRLLENVILRVTPLGMSSGSPRIGKPLSFDARQADADNDRLPDSWEKVIADANPTDGMRSPADVFGEADFDGDGKSNRSEYFAGTNPTDGQSFLSVRCARGLDTDAVISWHSAKGKTYRLLYCDGMGNGWQTLGESMWGTGDWMEYRDPTAKLALLRFYKVEVE